MIPRLLQAHVAVIFVMTATAGSAMPFRSIDGSGNSPGDHGAAGSTLIRLAADAYDDRLSVPRGGYDPSALPSARAISSAVAAQPRRIPSRNGTSDWLWQWGQFLDHDIDLTEVAHGDDPFDIPVPRGDKYFDPYGLGDKKIAMQRSLYETDQEGVRQQVNEITAYIDASQVYGSDSKRAAALRGDGSYLRMSVGGNGEVLLGRNDGGYPNAEMGPALSSEFFFAGDVRANEQIGLTAAHTLFAREHNRLVDELNARITSGDAALMAARKDSIDAQDNGIKNHDDFIFEAARKIVGAQVQKITYTEFLPVLLGVDLTKDYSGYDEKIDAGISTEFSTAAFRVGHTMLSPELLRVEPGGAPGTATKVALRDAFFNPNEVFENGVDSLLLGLASKRAQRIDTFLVDDVRNFLFGPPGADGLDLASLNLQRGRDHGVGSLNAVRAELELNPYESFLELTGGNAKLADAFESVYKQIDDVDLWIGGLAELPYEDSMLGQTFTRILMDQFTRSMVGDRFFYLAEMDALRMMDDDFMSSTSLSSIILRNSSIESIQANVFFAVDEPGTLALGVLALLLTGFRSRLTGVCVNPGHS